MIVYQTDFDGVLLGEVLADPSPLEQGVWLIPAGCVEQAPPTVSDGQRARWMGTAWAVEDVPPPPALEPEQDPTPQDTTPVLTPSQWQFFLDLTGFRADIDATLDTMPKATMTDRVEWAALRAIAYTSPEYTLQTTIALAAQFGGEGSPSAQDIEAAWTMASQFQGAASLGGGNG